MNNYSDNVCIQICYLLTQYTYNLNLIFLILNLYHDFYLILYFILRSTFYSYFNLFTFM